MRSAKLGDALPSRRVSLKFRACACILRACLSLAEIRNYSQPTSKQEKQYSVTLYSRHRENSQLSRPQWLLCDLSLAAVIETNIKTSHNEYSFASGEHVIVGAGEVHLQRCIDDLEQRFAGIKLNVSAPIVPFRETIVPPPTVDRVNEAIVSETSTVQTKQIDTEEGGEGNKTTLDKDKGLIEIKTANRMCTLHIRAIPLPAEVTRLIESKSDLIKVLVTVSSASTVNERRQLASEVNVSTREALKTFYQELCAAFEEAGNSWHGAADDIWAFGPRRIGSNVLLNRVPGYKRPSMWQSVGIAGIKKSNLLLRYF